MNVFSVAKTLLISRVSFRCEEIERQMQEMTCVRFGTEQRPLMAVFAGSCGTTVAPRVRMGVAEVL